MSSDSIPILVDNGQYRLPTDLKPKHYDITFKTDLEKLSFHGLVRINLDVVANTSAITLNTSDLDLAKASLTSDALSGEQALVVSTFDKTQERTTFQLPSNLPAGSTAELKIGYSGELTGSMMGYYKSAYEVDGTTKHYALTQFEAIGARRAFPCWDEPLLKATFAITMISREGTVNLSNMPFVSEEPLDLSHGVNTPSDLEEIVAAMRDENWTITKFDTTPPMSTYIVAWANGAFEHLESSVKMPLSGKTIPLRIYATKDHIHQAQFALDIKVSVLPLYEKIFDVEYPLPKLDTLVVSDFDAGAMENWGLITGRTSIFLLDPERGDLQAKKRIATVQRHEVAHMWFGNITTLAWWNYLYLNEGFATFMGEIIVADRIWPEWRVTSEFITTQLNRALDLDAKLSSHPIEVECPDANRINEIFDSLSYSKAAAVLRMLSAYIGEDIFLKGVSIYLKSRLFGNSVTADLWEGINTSSGINITDLMENWVTKTGYPVLSVTEDDSGIFVRQDRFLEFGMAEEKDNETIWNVPLGIVTEEDGKRSVDRTSLLSQRITHIKLDVSKPFKLNADTFDRVLYTSERLSAIAVEAAKDSSIFSLDDRLGLVHDAFALAKAGLAKISSALTLVDLWKYEKDYLIWSAIGESISSLISAFWESPDIVDALNKLRRDLFSPLVKKLGYSHTADESLDAGLLRTLAISQAARANDEDVVVEIQSRFMHFSDTGDDFIIPADLQSTIFSTAVEHGGRSEWEAMVKLHDKPKTPQEKINAIASLCATQHDDLIKETLEFIDKKARDQDVLYFFTGLGANFKARRALTDHFYNNYNVLYKRFEANWAPHHLVTHSSDYYSSTKDLKRIDDFFKDKDSTKYKLALAQALDGIRARAAFVDRSKEDLKAWLAERA